MQDSERRRAGSAQGGPIMGGTVTELRIARIQRVPQEPEPAGAATTPRIDSRSLFRNGSREVVITHDGADYRLRLTASGKLILTK